MSQFFNKPVFNTIVSSAILALTSQDQGAVISGAGQGSEAWIHNNSSMNGGSMLAFIAYGQLFSGGVRVGAIQMAPHTPWAIVTSTGPGTASDVKIRNASTAAIINSIAPYTASFTGGIFVAAGDITGDGAGEVITGPDQGVGPNVKAFDASNGAVLRNFYAFEPGFTGGVRVAAGDVNGDGVADIVVARGPGATCEVKVFDGLTNVQIRSFTPYTSYSGGVYVAAGDVNGDGHADIITGKEGAPEVKVFSGVNNSVLLDFAAFDPGTTVGVRVGSADVTGDGRADIIACVSTGSSTEIRTFSGLNGALVGSMLTQDLNSGNGFWVGAIPVPRTCPADIAPAFAGNGVVDIDDLVAVITAWGNCPAPGHCAADITPVGLGDGAVNIDDLVKVITSWGACP